MGTDISPNVILPNFARTLGYDHFEMIERSVKSMISLISIHPLEIEPLGLD